MFYRQPEGEDGQQSRHDQAAAMRGSLIAEWRVYADNEPIRALMRKTH
jgi:hypothetical protein